jgi:transitional endoplasmic reticulum ATPase
VTAISGAQALEQFEWHKQQGLAAHSRGEFGKARYHLLKAADHLFHLATSSAEPIKSSRVKTAERLVAMARGLPDTDTPNGTRERTAGESEGATATASNWQIPEKPSIKLDDIAGLDDVKDMVWRRVIYPRQHPELAAKYAVKPGGGMLLYGPPGTGKTLFARAVAGQIDAPFYSVTAGDVLSKWVGEAEQNIQKLFDDARQHPLAVIFIDEIDALTPRRADQQSGVMTRVVPQILAELEGVSSAAQSPLLFIGATNEPWSLDAAMLRPGRFDELFLIDLPDDKARLWMFDRHLTHRAEVLEDSIDFGALVAASDGRSGADIRSLCDRAASAAFRASVETNSVALISQTQLLDLIARTPPSVSTAARARFNAFADGKRGE